VSGFSRTIGYVRSVRLQPDETLQIWRLKRLKIVDDFAIWGELPSTPEARNIRDQLARSATGIAANYRATCRARSRAEFLAKLGMVVEEADESHMWLDMVLRLHLAGSGEVERLRQEADELTAIFVASRRTASRSRAGANRKSINLE
jgi:four helix bundle protein